jgi:hypothetical protein
VSRQDEVEREDRNRKGENGSAAEKEQTVRDEYRGQEVDFFA